MLRKTALGLLLAGLAFVFFKLTFAGIDLLIDAVGFVLVFNGAKTLRAWARPFWPAALCALGLVVLSALELFLQGGVLAAVSLARGLGEAALLLLLGAGLHAMLRADGWRWDAAFARISLWLCAAVSTVYAGLVVYTEGSPPPHALAVFGLIAHLAAIISLLRALFLPGGAPRQEG